MIYEKCFFCKKSGDVYFATFGKDHLGNKIDPESNKNKVTDSAVSSVAIKLLTQDVTFEFSANGKRYAMSVVEIEE